MKFIRIVNRDIHTDRQKVAKSGWNCTFTTKTSNDWVY